MLHIWTLWKMVLLVWYENPHILVLLLFFSFWCFIRNIEFNSMFIVRILVIGFRFIFSHIYHTLHCSLHHFIWQILYINCATYSTANRSLVKLLLYNSIYMKLGLSTFSNCDLFYTCPRTACLVVIYIYLIVSFCDNRWARTIVVLFWLLLNVNIALCSYCQTMKRTRCQQLPRPNHMASDPIFWMMLKSSNYSKPSVSNYVKQYV